MRCRAALPRSPGAIVRAVNAQITEPPPRRGRLLAGAEQHVIPAEAMAASWQVEKPVWYLINDRLGTLIDEYEDETLTSDQAVVAADVIRASVATEAEQTASALQAAADFLEWHGGAGDEVRVVL